MTEIDVFHPVVGASPPPPGPPGAVEGLQAAGGLDMAPPPGDLAAASALMDASMAAHTIRAYARDWRAWTAYAGAHHLEPLPAEPAHVCAFLAAYSHGRKATTTQRAAMAIGKAHGLAGLANPIDHEHVRRTLAGLRRTKGTAPRQAAPCAPPTSNASSPSPVTTGGADATAPSSSSATSAPSAVVSSPPSTPAISRPDPKGFWCGSAGPKSTRTATAATRPPPRPRTPELCAVRAVRAWQQAAGISSTPPSNHPHPSNSAVPWPPSTGRSPPTSTTPDSAQPPEKTRGCAPKRSI